MKPASCGAVDDSGAVLIYATNVRHLTHLADLLIKAETTFAMLSPMTIRDEDVEDDSASAPLADDGRQPGPGQQSLF